MKALTPTDARREAESLLDGIKPGEDLDPLSIALIRLGVGLSVTALNERYARLCIEGALDVGASSEQVQEILQLVSTLGVHTLMVGSTLLAHLGGNSDSSDIPSRFDPDQQELWDAYVGNTEYWSRMEVETPGFLASLLHLSPTGFQSFMSYCSIPWKSKSVSTLNKELVSLACDASPQHIYLPGLRFHLRNAIALGASKNQILQALDLAAENPTPTGIT